MAGDRPGMSPSRSVNDDLRSARSVHSIGSLPHRVLVPELEDPGLVIVARSLVDFELVLETMTLIRTEDGDPLTVKQVA